MKAIAAKVGPKAGGREVFDGWTTGGRRIAGRGPHQWTDGPLGTLQRASFADLSQPRSGTTGLPITFEYLIRSENGSNLSKLFGRKYASIGPAEARPCVDAGAVLLDVRESSEWRAGYAPKARHIPAERTGASTEGNPGWPGGHHGVPFRRPILQGRRASRRRRAHRAELSGRMRAWSSTGLPIIAKGGRPGTMT
jgi:rhodanese-related sulfurtransferase